MREIKFRFYYQAQQKMSPPYTLSEILTCRDCNKIQIDDGNTVPMQYTGLKDKNGVEIYEGYIVLTGEDYVGVVEFEAEGDSTGYVIDTGEEDIDVIIYTGEGFKESLTSPLLVLGSIYEHYNLIINKL